jgi:hypothetical protein
MLDAAVRNVEQVYTNTSGKVFAVEGFNEVNNFGFIYEGVYYFEYLLVFFFI